MNKFKIIIVMIFLLVFTGCSNAEYIRFNSAVDVAIQDYTGESFSFFLTNAKQYTVLTENISKDSTKIFVNDTTNCEIFDAIDIYDNDSYYQSLILNKTLNYITLNTEIDKNFSNENTIIKCGEWDLSTSDGSTSQEIFSITPPYNSTWHITTTAINILDNKPMDSSLFGGELSLNNGISGRIVDGYTRTLFIIYNNNGFFLRGFDIDYISKAPAGVYGFNAILDFKKVYGAVIELNGNTNDTWEGVNRDNLLELDEVAITIMGHYVTN